MVVSEYLKMNGYLLRPVKDVEAKYRKWLQSIKVIKIYISRTLKLIQTL